MITLKDGRFLVCPVCAQLMFADGDIYETLVGYRSPGGHNHNDNCLIRVYRCPAGHYLNVSVRRMCPVCDWKGKTQCFCHPGKKLDKWPEDVEPV